ncbi:MAG: CRTAC1 family protein [Candidatus Latescibacteria bacterium]|nr:CRTAC1 family protein [Candidatus Latescibacterota bacterium]
MGPGCAFFDYDGDGHLDIYLIDGAQVPGTQLPEQPMHRLYHNQANGHFEDVTAATGVGNTGYGMGCAAADYDNDGDQDLFVSNFGPDALYRNEGGRFTEVAARAGVSDTLWSSSCAFADVDNDGLLDLYVANYHDFSYANHKVCAEGGSGLQLYCGPESFDGVRDFLYHNEGDGTFEDVTVQVGLFNTTGKELGVVFGDVDRDGDQDLYLANDKTANLLYLNDGKGHFEEVGLLAGVAYNGDGKVSAGMGVDMGDYDDDGWMDLFVTNFQWETNTLYRNNGDGTFVDQTYDANLGKDSIPYLKWGTRIFDFDNDGDRDIFVASGHLESDVEKYENTTFPQLNQLFVNDGKNRFELERQVAGTGLAVKKVSRGAAFGDYDDDGDVDILVANCADTPDLLRNDGGDENNYLRVKLQGTRSNRDGIGGIVEVFSGDLYQLDLVRSGASYLSQSDLRLSFGLGHRIAVDRLKVTWPSGLVEEVKDVPINRDLTLIEGSN